MLRLCATRRGLLALAALPAARPALAGTSVPEAATLLAPGPEEGPAAGFAERAARGLARGLVQASALRVSIVGGPDGITAANRFAASTPADGRVLLVLPGLAAQALLLGDGRARFEPRHWPAVTASLGPVLLAGRGDLSETQPIRIALPAPTAPEAAGLLALDLLGRPATPLLVAAGVAPEAAVAAGAADAVLLSGRNLLARASALSLQPWLTFDGGTAVREPALPGVPTLGELLPDPARPDLLAAARAAAASLRVQGVLVLPALTSSDTVALWRGAARRWAEEELEGAEAETRRIAAEDAAAALATLCPPSEVALAYRDWLRRRLGFQTG
ncbi:hypothetical protein [Falsiroseomonas oryziterrae]|uniref:hypothetical protein n=1 Tax=Falsiroseomonas oryziterrae TaxID=2911368 RepID=UPI001F3AC59F|nr:hypothetical protein [Roseomonas sp. NPKOSM-4]